MPNKSPKVKKYLYIFTLAATSAPLTNLHNVIQRIDFRLSELPFQPFVKLAIPIIMVPTGLLNTIEPDGLKIGVWGKILKKSFGPTGRQLLLTLSTDMTMPEQDTGNASNQVRLT